MLKEAKNEGREMLKKAANAGKGMAKSAEISVIKQLVKKYVD